MYDKVRAHFFLGILLSFSKKFSCMLFCRSQCSGFAAMTCIALANVSPALPGDKVFYRWLFPRHLLSRAQIRSTCPCCFVYAVAWYWSPEIWGFTCGVSYDVVGHIVPEWCSSAVGVLDHSGSVGWTVQLGHVTIMVRAKAHDKGSTRLCVGPVTTSYGPACDIHTCVWGLVSTRYGLICVPAFVLSLSPALRHRGAPRKHLPGSWRSTGADPQTRHRVWGSAVVERKLGACFFNHTPENKKKCQE